MGTKERLRAYLKLKGISQSDFLNSIGASPGYIAAMSKGFGPRYEPMVREKYPDLNIGWILTGDGQMLNGSAPAVPAGSRAPHIGRLPGLQNWCIIPVKCAFI